MASIVKFLFIGIIHWFVAIRQRTKHIVIAEMILDTRKVNK